MHKINSSVKGLIKTILTTIEGDVGIGKSRGIWERFSNRSPFYR